MKHINFTVVSHPVTSRWYDLPVAWTLRLSEDEEAALSAQAAMEGRSKHEITRDAIRNYITRQRTWDEYLSDGPVVYG
ncbi:CopG family transcriptional regulator [Nocardia sp. CDC160]|uniref:CopG family transcriptional regulator n=1 Tax=Nocardia sp. CDC160 TaxID=3112166 RepID=UPI002DB7B147|nr:CopG family transcriptional regulator [Nocardia sp. CDC160]MEC3915343.1 CopG family transcriptional regulator [Nocardia sp. CDC160]